MAKRKYSRRSVTYKGKNQAERSYQAYLNWRQKDVAKGRDLKSAMSKEEFFSMKRKHKDAFGNTTNVARSLAHSDRIVQNINVRKRLLKKFQTLDYDQTNKKQMEEAMRAALTGLTIAQQNEVREMFEKAYY